MRYFGITLLVLGIVALGGCQTAPEQPQAAEPAPRPVLEKLTPRGYVRRGIEYLASGDAENARLYLEETLSVDPDNRRAKMLLEQIDADPQQMLGAASRTYRVRRGQTLANIAEQYLGDPLKFYILARYNNIDNPSRLEVGQQIRIPGSRPLEPAPPPKPERVVKPQPPPPRPEPAPAQPAVAEPEEEPEEEDEIVALPEPVEPDEEPDAEPPVAAAPEQPSDYDRAEALYDAGNYQGSIALLEGSTDPRSQALLADIYIAQAEALQNQGDMTGARSRLQQARSLRPNDAGIQQRLDAINAEIASREADRLYQQAIAERQAGQLEKAYATFNKVRQVDPDHAQVQQQMADIRSTLVDDYHRQALMFYNQQQMCQAIALWDQVLRLDPNHAPALTNQDKAQRIVEKLGQECR